MPAFRGSTEYACYCQCCVAGKFLLTCQPATSSEQNSLDPVGIGRGINAASAGRSMKSGGMSEGRSMQFWLTLHNRTPWARAFFRKSSLKEVIFPA